MQSFFHNTFHYLYSVLHAKEIQAVYSGLNEFVYFLFDIRNWFNPFAAA